MKKNVVYIMVSKTFQTFISQSASIRWPDKDLGVLQIKVCNGRLHIEECNQPFWALLLRLHNPY